jgi:glc operon protein GlcG
MGIAHRFVLVAAILVGVAAVAPPGHSQAPERLTLADALALIDAGQKEAAAKSLRLSFAVVDARGDLVALARMPGATPATADTAIGKAMLSAMFGQPSANFAGRGNTPLMQSLNDVSGGRLRFFQGALPIVRNGFTIGAFGSSGAAAQQDEDAVRVALGGFK